MVLPSPAVCQTYGTSTIGVPAAVVNFPRPALRAAGWGTQPGDKLQECLADRRDDGGEMQRMLDFAPDHDPRARAGIEEGCERTVRESATQPVAVEQVPRGRALQRRPVPRRLGDAARQDLLKSRGPAGAFTLRLPRGETSEHGSTPLPCRARSP
jgi:hypothetical protein